MITIYIGKSGSGKDTFLRTRVREGMKPVISYTTRPMREGELNGVDYNFVSTAEFKELENAGKIAESRSYHTMVAGNPDIWYYGSPKLDPSDNDYVAVVDIQGAKSYLSLYGASNLEICYIDTSDDIRESRAMSRGSFDKIEWDRRKADDDIKFSKDNLHELEQMYGKPLTIIENNEERPVA